MSFDILSKETVLKSRLFLEASAGTGKTFTIEHLFIRLLIETSLTFDEIVIVTFTRAATRELRERIRKNLEEVSRQAVTYAYLEGISWEQRAKINEALRNFDSAKIFTIHGFCSHLLSQFAMEVGVGLKLSEWTSEEMRWEVKEFLRSQVSLCSGQLRRLLGSFQYEVDSLEEALIDYSGKEEKIFSAEELLEQVNHELQSTPFFPITQEFEAIRSSYKGMTEDNFSAQASDLEEALLRKEISFVLWDQWIINPAFFLKNLKTSHLKVRAKMSASAQLLHLREIVVPRLERAQNPRLIFLRVCAGWAARRKTLSEAREKITPDDLLRLVHSKLSDETFITLAQQKYKTVIVDEFQDTDSFQWEIFKTLFNSIYLIGDPKQSIYGFRQADIYTFLEAGKTFALDEKKSLVHNFRSTSGLLNQLNTLFCQSPWMEMPKQESFLQIPQAVAAIEGEGNLCFMIAEGEKGRSSKWPTPLIEETQLFPFIVQEIQKNGLDAAILVKDRYQATRIKNFLEFWGVPTLLHRTTSLVDSSVIEFIEEVVKACLDESAIRKMLLGPFAAVPVHALLQELVFQAKIELEKLQPLWEKGFASFFAAFLKVSFWQESAYNTFCQLQNMRDLMDLIQKIPFVTTPYQLRKILESLKISEKKDRTIASSEVGVQIMTTHASKGLEFETVFALGIGSRSPEQGLSEEALKELDAEKMRQFYVALTRAKKRLYIPIIKQLPAPSYELGEGSPVELFLAAVNPDLSSFSQEFLNGRQFHLERLEMKELEGVAPVLFKVESCPRYIQSFSSLAQEVGVLVKGEAQGIASGRETGIVFHRILERYFNGEADLYTVIVQETKRTKLAAKVDELEEMIRKTLELSLEDFCLKDIALDRLQTEMEFFYETPQGWMRGYIDLCFEYAGKLYVVDWKTNLLENTSEEAVFQVMQGHGYLLQAEIYATAMQKYLVRFSDIDFGGVYFVFVRGPVVYRV